MNRKINPAPPEPRKPCPPGHQEKPGFFLGITLSLVAVPPFFFPFFFFEKTVKNSFRARGKDYSKIKFLALQFHFKRWFLLINKFVTPEEPRKIADKEPPAGGEEGGYLRQKFIS